METKTILITGASGGMGTALAEWFLKGRYRLVLHYFDHKPLIEESERVFHVQSDFRDVTQVAQMTNVLNQLSGGIDILINNAGISRSAMSWKVSEVDWNETLAVNLTAPFLLMKSIVPYMRSSEYGRIINISSVVAQTYKNTIQGIGSF
jgi:NAD(P)-dependent dehydrogenase (short-subunit alcohol dehydrogenase family)